MLEAEWGLLAGALKAQDVLGLEVKKVGPERVEVKLKWAERPHLMAQ